MSIIELTGSSTARNSWFSSDGLFFFSGYTFFGVSSGTFGGWTLEKDKVA